MNDFAAELIKLCEKYGIYENEQQFLLNVANNIDRAKLCRQIVDCKECQLYKSTSHKVPGEGPKSSLMIIGESAGETENATGRPFVGPAGQLLDKILADCCIDRSKIYITNAVKCHPPYNRNPEFDELGSCARLYLARELDYVKPKHIVVMGSVAASLFTESSISSMRGKTIEYKGYPVTFTYHPAYILRKKDAEYTQMYDVVVDDLLHVMNDLVQTHNDTSVCTEMTVDEEKMFGLERTEG